MAESQATTTVKEEDGGSSILAQEKPGSCRTDDDKAEKEALDLDGGDSVASVEEEGVRAKRMREIFGKCRRKFISKIRPVHHFFPYLKGRKAVILKDLVDQMTTQLGKFLDEEFDQILVDHNMVAKLNKLDAIVLDPANHTADGSLAWRPSGSAEKDINLHDTESVLHVTRLRQKLAELEAENKHLQEDVACRRQVHDVAMRRMEQMWQKVTKLESALDASPLDNITGFLDQQTTLTSAALTRGRKRKRKQ